MESILPVLMIICAAAGFTYVPMAFNDTVFDVAAIKGIMGLHFCGIEYINMLRVNNGVASTMHIIRSSGNAMAIACWHTMIYQLWLVRASFFAPSPSPAPCT